MSSEIVRVAPKRVYGNGLWNPFTHRKKYEIVCGHCDHVFTQKVSFLTDFASAICPGCGTQNHWLHSKFAEDYERSLGGL